MDEEKKPEQGTSNTDAAKAAAKDAARDLKVEAEKTIAEIKGRGLKGFFSFDQLYFPIVARYVFIVLVILGVVGIVFGVLGGLIALFTGNFVAGFSAIIGSIIGGVLGVLFTRIWFEMFVVAFKINENLEKIRDK